MSKKIVLTDEQKIELEPLSAVLSIKQIADYFGFSHDTFSRLCERDEDILRIYKKGKSKAIGVVAKGLLTKARDGDTASQIFYLKTQAGWKEKSEVDLNMTGDVNVSGNWTIEYIRAETSKS